MNFPALKIGNLMPKYPIIQGGMAIKASMAKLAAAVANEGGIGVIAGTGLTPEELKEEILKAKSMTKGIIGVNIMFAATEFVGLVKASIEAGIDLIISGAGFSRDMFPLGQEANIPVVPIVSTVKLAKISEKLGAAAIIVEGGNAGGHLGTDKDSWDIVKEIKESVSIPVIGAGGVITPEDAVRMFGLGVDGIQMGTRFIASEESDVADCFKEMFTKTKNPEDVITIMSSAGLPANAIRTPFSQKVLDGNPPPPERCTNCLKHCSRKFCVKDALIRGHEGDMERGLYFTGKDIFKIKEVLSVKEIFNQFVNYND